MEEQRVAVAVHTYIYIYIYSSYLWYSDHTHALRGARVHSGCMHGLGLPLSTTHVMWLMCFLPCFVIAAASLYMELPAADRPAPPLAFRRLNADLERRTVCEHHEGLLPSPSSQFWYDQSLGITWWDLDLLYQSERDNCGRVMKKAHWLTEFKSRVAVSLATADGTPPFMLRRANRDTVPTTTCLSVAWVSWPNTFIDFAFMDGRVGRKPSNRYMKY